MGIKTVLDAITLEINGVLSDFNKFKKTRVVEKPLVAVQALTANGKGEITLSILITIKTPDMNTLYTVTESVITTLQSVVKLKLDRGEFLSGTDGAYSQLTFNQTINLYSNDNLPLQEFIGHSENIGFL